MYSGPCSAFPNLGSQSSFSPATRQRLVGDMVMFTDVYYESLFFFQPSRKSKEDFRGTDVILVDTEGARGCFGVDVDHCDGWLGTEVDF